jgi:UDP:flavonoid glycosyltransferase YjiC (YdhE family)
MARFLFFPYTNQLGSTVPSITLANLLRDKGHDVMYASGGKYTHIIREKGFPVYPINEISYHQYRRHVDNNNVDFYECALVEHFVDMEMELIQQLKPDVIVTNNRPTIKISAERTNTKVVTIVIPTLTKYYNYDYFIPENHFLNTIYPFGDANAIMPQSLIQLAFKLTMKQWAKNLNKVRKTYGLTPLESYLDVYEGDVTLINQTKGITPFKPLPPNYYFLEQALGSTFGNTHSWIDKLDQHRQAGQKVIFVSMGSSALKSYPMVMQAIKDFVVQHKNYVLVSNHVGLQQDGIIEDRMYIESFINAAQILPRADVVVTHGGINTLSECILNQIPVVGVPEQGEQMWNLKYAEHIGAGKMVSKFKLEKDPTILIDALKQVLENNQYAKNLQQFTHQLKQTSKHTDEREAMYNAIMALI